MGQFNFINVASCAAKFAYLERSGIIKDLEKETGRERVIRMFKKNEIGFVSPELLYIMQSASTVTAVAAIFGGVAQMNQAKADFFRRNVASVYESQHLGRRALVDTLTLSALKGAYKAALKYGSFSSLYLLSTMTVENYRNKFSIWEHIGSGALLGAIYRCNFGLKGMLAAGALGAVLGSAAGGLLKLHMWFTGMSTEDFRYWQHEYYYTKVLHKKVDEKEES